MGMTPACPPPNVTLKVVGKFNDPLHAKNILFLGDGFADTAEDKKLFNEVILNIRKHFFKQRPFDLPLLKSRSRFNFFKASTPSVSSGISYQEMDINDNISEGHVAADGTPNPNAIGRLAEKPSALGLTYQIIELEPGKWIPTPFPQIRWKRGYATCVMDVVNSLNFRSNPVIPKCWDPHPPSISSDPIRGRDRGLVCVLVNDDVMAAYAVSIPSAKDAYIAVSLGSIEKFNKTDEVSPRLYDHDPISPTRRWYKRILHAIIHEFGHSHFRLGDEYEGENDPSIGNFLTNPCSDPTNEHPLCRPNLTTNVDVSYPPVVDAGKIKWLYQLFPDSTERTIPVKVIKYLENTGSYSSSGPLYINTNTDLKKAMNPRKPSSQQLIQDLKTEYRVRNLEMIIGLFEGGGGYYNGVYTPAGICKMRAAFHPDGPPFRAADHDFCYICMYKIVEKISIDLGVPPKPLLKQLAKKYDPFIKRRQQI